jgi:1,5-anhydro-D-fructose reductase (1,5-anhydro-D-mannitol-forming)
MKIGIISTSRIADRAHAPAINALQNAELWSVYSRSRDRAFDFAKRHEASAPNPAFDDLDAFLSDPQLDAVVVTSADKLHSDHVIACASYGKHVLVEKPFATDIASGQAAIDACKANNVVLAVAYHLRWHPGHRQLLQHLRQRTIGDVQHFRFLYTWLAGDGSNWRARDEVGQWWSLGGTGTHCLDLLRWFGGQSFSNVVKRTATVRSGTWSNHDETAILTYEFANGMTAEVTSSVLFDSPSRFEIFGTEGHAVCEATAGDLGAGRIEIAGKPMQFTPQSPFEGEIGDFISAIENNHEPEVSGETALENVNELVLTMAR